MGGSEQGVSDQAVNVDWVGPYSFLEGGFELRDDIVAFDASNIKAFGPPL